MYRFLVFALSAVLINGCSSGGGDDTGTVSVSITDDPVTDAVQVVLAVSGVTFKGPDGTETFPVTSTDPVTLEDLGYLAVPLMDYQGSLSGALISDVEMTAGSYQWIRLEVITETVDSQNVSYVELEGGAKHPLTIPSENQSGLKLNRGFTLPANGSANFTLDVDLQKSLVKDGIGYKLKPVIRMVDNVEVGHITGEIDSTILSGEGCNSTSVYLFSGSDTEPTDINGDTGPDLVTEMNENNQFEFGFVLAGDYTMSVVCDTDPSADVDTRADDPTQPDSLAFIHPSLTRNVTVEAQKTVVANIPLAE